MEIQVGTLKRTDKVLIVDDLLATGGTAGAACELVSRIGATIVEISFLIELTELKGINKLQNYKTYSLVTF